MQIGPELIADYACHTGEGPLWYPDEERLYWVDIPAGRLFWYDPATGKHELCLETEAIGALSPCRPMARPLFMAMGAVKTLRDGRLETIIEDIPDERKTRFNDVFANAEGRVFCGTMAASGRKRWVYHSFAVICRGAVVNRKPVRNIALRHETVPSQPQR